MHYDLIQRIVIVENFTRKKSYKKCHSPFKIKNIWQFWKTVSLLLKKWQWLCIF